MNEHPNRAERRGHGEPEERLVEPSPIIYSKDPWDMRRFSPFAPRRQGRTSTWAAAAPFLLVGGGAALLALVVLVVLLIKALAG